MRIRELAAGDEREALRMRRSLWPECDEAEHESELRVYLDGAAEAAMLVCERPEGGLCGFAEVGLRSHAEGYCGHVAVGYLEGWYVDPDCRRRGIGAELVQAAEAWARELGCTALASDAELDNEAGQLAHVAVGFQEVERNVHYLRAIEPVRAAEPSARTATSGSLRAGIPDALPDELATVLLRERDLRVERIVSRGHVSPPGFWYEQDDDELVLVVEGAAKLEIEGDGEIELAAGDWIDLPRRVRHRVSWTDPDRDTIWLAVFRRRTP